MRAETLTALYLGRDAIEEENIWTMQSMLPEEPGRRRRKKKTETLCGICGAEESLHFPEEIRKPLSVLMCWMSRHGMKNQIQTQPIVSAKINQVEATNAVPERGINLTEVASGVSPHNPSIEKYDGAGNYVEDGIPPDGAPYTEGFCNACNCP